MDDSGLEEGGAAVSHAVEIPEGFPLDVDPDRLAQICQAYGVRELSVFGSVLRDDFTPSSDVDVLYALAPTSPIRTLFDLGRLAADLEDALGRRVDLANQARLYPGLRQEILSTAKGVYAQA